MVSISKIFRAALVVVVLSLGLTGAAACNGDDADPVTEGCDRLDECNALNPGISAGECVEQVDVTLENATPSQRNDWETLMEGCLEFDTCSAFLSCVDANGL